MTNYLEFEPTKQFPVNIDGKEVVVLDVQDVEYGVRFKLPELEVLSREDLRERLETAFPEYYFDF